MITLALHEKAELLGLIPRQLVGGVVPWFCDELADTEAARDRLRAWAAGGGFARPRQDSTKALLKVVKYYGDGEVWLAVVAALDRVPPPVQDFIVDTTAILGVGVSLRGFALMDPLRAHQRVIVVSGVGDAGTFRDVDEVVHTALHEIAHVWLEPDPDPSDPDPGAITAFAQGALIMRARREGWEDDVQRERRAQENRARNLVRRWGTAP